VSDTMQNNNMPLRFHKFIWYVWIPYSILSAIYVACTRLYGYLTVYTPFEYGGLLLLIFLLYSLFEALFVAAPIAIFVGFFRWKKYAWYILMILKLSNVICSPLLIIFQSYDATTIVIKLLRIAFDCFILYYYWHRRHLFKINFPKSKISVSPSTRIADTCYKCGHSLPARNKFCPFCGTSLSTPPSFCKECGLKLPLNSKFCPQCGTQVSN